VDLKQAVEAVLFVSDDPVPLNRLHDLLPDARPAEIKDALQQLKSEYESQGLAIVAYKQPIKRADLEAIRGVQSGEILRALMERRLVRIAGREDAPGAPVQYGTTKEFLGAFGLGALEDLPRPEEVK